MVTYIFYRTIIVCILSSLILKNKLRDFYRKEKRYKWKRAKEPYSGVQIMTANTTTFTNALRPRHIDGMIFRQLSYDNIPYARHFLPVRFFPKYYFNKLSLGNIPAGKV